MVTSADDLLRQAQHELYAATQQLPIRGHGRQTAARIVMGGYAAAWPTLAQAHLHVLRPGLILPVEDLAMAGPFPVTEMGRLRVHLQRIAQGRIEHVDDAVEPEPHLMRAAQLTMAAGDALHVVHDTQGRQEPGFGTVDRALANLDHAARLTAVYAEHSNTRRHGARGPSRQWLWISEHAQAARHSADPNLRSSPVGSAPVISSEDTALPATLDRWRAAATDALGPTDSPTTRLPMIAAALAMVHSAAAAIGLEGNHRELADAWGAAGNAWRGGAIRLPGPDHLPLRAQTQQVRSDLDHLVHQHHLGERAVHASNDRQALARFLTHPAPQIEADYITRTTQLVQSMRPVIAARMLAREVGTPVPPRLAAAARAGRWVPLPPSSASAKQLREATAAARRRPEPPVQDIRPSLSAAASRARAVSAHGSSRSIQQMLNDGRGAGEQWQPSPPNTELPHDKGHSKGHSR